VVNLQQKRILWQNRLKSGEVLRDTHPQKRACIHIYNIPLEYTDQNYQGTSSGSWRAANDTKKTPRAGASGVGSCFVVCLLCLCSSCVRSIIAVVVQNYLAGAAQIYIDYPPIYLPPNFKVKIV
jgi:hypothetical protein